MLDKSKLADLRSYNMIKLAETTKLATKGKMRVVDTVAFWIVYSTQSTWNRDLDKNTIY